MHQCQLSFNYNCTDIGAHISMMHHCCFTNLPFDSYATCWIVLYSFHDQPTQLIGVLDRGKSPPSLCNGGCWPDKQILLTRPISLVSEDSLATNEQTNTTKVLRSYLRSNACSQQLSSSHLKELPLRTCNHKQENIKQHLHSKYYKSCLLW